MTEEEHKNFLLGTNAELDIYEQIAKSIDSEFVAHTIKLQKIAINITDRINCLIDKKAYFIANDNDYRVKKLCKAIDQLEKAYDDLKD